jgi:Fe-S-cluster containining protein
MVLQEAPCTFLDDDNSCSIYDVRPKACREYPHTNRKKFIQLTGLTLKNTEICPAVFNIVEELKKKFPL